MTCSRWRPLRVDPLEVRKKAALPDMIEEQKRLCFNRIQGDSSCDLGMPGYLLCPGCAAFKKRWKIPTRDYDGA